MSIYEAPIFYDNKDVRNLSAEMPDIGKYYEIVDDVRLAESIYAIRSDARLAGTLYAIRDDARLADSMCGIRTDARLADSMYPIRNDARLAESRYAIRNDARLADNVYTIGKFNDGKDVQYLDGIRVPVDCSMERKEELLDMLEMEDHSRTFPKDCEESLMLDKDNKLDGLSNLAGMIFMCNKKTKKDCFHHSLFGLPFNSWNLVKQVVPGTILFLFEYEARQLWGIFEAVSHGKININASAYSHSNGGGSFPAQVRVREIERFPPLEEREFKEAIRDNYFSDMKFEFALSWDQVQQLCEVFLKKSANKHMSNLDKEVIHFDHSSGKVKKTPDFLDRSDEVHDFQGPRDEEYIPIESIYRERKNFNEGQLHGFMSDYDLPGQFHRAIVEYHHSFSDRFDNSHLQVKNDDERCLEEENDLFSRKIYDFSEGPFSGRFLTSVSENKPDEFHGNANRLMYSPHNSEVYGLTGSKEKTSSLLYDRNRALAGIDHAREYTPPPIACDFTQAMCEHMLEEECRNTILSGLEPDKGEKGFRHINADRLKRKPSVWSRISGHDDLSLWSSRNRNIGNKRTTRPSTRDGPEKFVTREEVASNGQNMLDLILEEPVVSDEPEMLINFKRRRSVCISKELEKTDEKKRRKLIRPDFSHLIMAQDKGKDVISTHEVEPQTKNQPNSIQDKVLSSNIVEDREHASFVNSGTVIKQPLEAGKTSTESEPSLSFEPSKSCVDLDGQNQNGCEEIYSKGDTEPESNNQCAGVCSGGDLLKEKVSEVSFEQGPPILMDAATFGSICTKQTNNIDDNRDNVSGGQTLTNEI